MHNIHIVCMAKIRGKFVANFVMFFINFLFNKKIYDLKKCSKSKVLKLKH